MKIILKEDVRKQGLAGEMLEVADGYASYLIREGKAEQVTASVLERWKRKNEEMKLQDNLKRKDAEVLKEILESNPLVFTVRAKNGKTFGNITSMDVANRLNELHSSITYAFCKKNIDIPKTPTLGIYNSTVTIYKNIVANVLVDVREE